MWFKASAKHLQHRVTNDLVDDDGPCCCVEGEDVFSVGQELEVVKATREALVCLYRVWDTTKGLHAGAPAIKL